MPKPPFPPDSLGVHRRRYDNINEEDNEQSSEEILRVLKWLNESVEERDEEKDEKSTNKLRELLDAGADLDQLDKVGALAPLKGASQKGMVMDKLWSVLKDVWYAGKDIVSSNRVKTSLTVVGGIAVGAAVGAVLGTLVFPAIGTAIGGAVGAAITAGIAAVGGAVGLGVIGGFIGSWFGKKISNKVFKQEKRFEISKRVTNKIKKSIGIDSSTVQMINGYLYNRAKAVKSPLCKKYYKSLRKLGILEASPTAMEKIARFLCNELVLLRQELAQNASPQLKMDLEAVELMLKKLKASHGLSAESKARITEAFKQSPSSTQVSTRTRQGVKYDTTDDLSPSVLEKSAKRFLEIMPDGIEEVSCENKKSANGSVKYKHHLRTKEGEALPEMVYKSKKDKRSHLLTMVTVKASQVTNSNQSHITKAIVAQAKAHHDNTGNKEVIVLAAGNDALAIELMLAIKKAGLKPKLSDKEYPSHDEQAQKRKKAILEKVQSVDKPTPVPRKGLEM